MDGTSPGRTKVPLQVAETAFEKRRGISRVERRGGYAQVHVSGLGEPLMESRMRVLSAISESGISIDFLKLTQDGLSFLVSQEQCAAAGTAIRGANVEFTLGENREVVLVHAVNMRDEEGLIAQIVTEAIGSGVEVDHISDMHDRMLMVVRSDDADRLQARIEEKLMAVTGAD